MLFGINIIILIITIINHKKQNQKNIETFANREFKNKHIVYSKCKKECVETRRFR